MLRSPATIRSLLGPLKKFEIFAKDLQRTIQARHGSGLFQGQYEPASISGSLVVGGSRKDSALEPSGYGLQDKHANDAVLHHYHCFTASNPSHFPMQ